VNPSLIIFCDYRERKRRLKEEKKGGRKTAFPRLLIIFFSEKERKKRKGEEKGGKMKKAASCGLPYFHPKTLNMVEKKRKKGNHRRREGRDVYVGGEEREDKGIEGVDKKKKKGSQFPHLFPFPPSLLIEEGQTAGRKEKLGKKEERKKRKSRQTPLPFKLGEEGKGDKVQGKKKGGEQWSRHRHPLFPFLREKGRGWEQISSTSHYYFEEEKRKKKEQGGDGGGEGKATAYSLHPREKGGGKRERGGEKEGKKGEFSLCGGTGRGALKARKRKKKGSLSLSSSISRRRGRGERKRGGRL